MHSIGKSTIIKKRFYFKKNVHNKKNLQVYIFKNKMGEKM